MPNINMLVVEDDLVNREIIYEFLTFGEVHIDLAADGLEAVDSVKDKAYGITDYVHKPFSEDELWRVINTYV